MATRARCKSTGSCAAAVRLTLNPSIDQTRFGSATQQQLAQKVRPQTARMNLINLKSAVAQSEAWKSTILAKVGGANIKVLRMDGIQLFPQ
jgi:hypothetical protein